MQDLIQHGSIANTARDLLAHRMVGGTLKKKMDNIEEKIIRVC